ncbi:hypothetical protein FOMPIDRAFT_1122160 [Fomitopsis schrenkii]|uniref:ARID domain-containing protein n=1 Tax=Fomitopsis schrenkii TaxID=2126942 RepID=S8FR48_FOMSC|nr:hypothetical protein FOMPIDRAFT_1122160 [Fomitopsis schrenkii]
MVVSPTQRFTYPTMTAAGFVAIYPKFCKAHGIVVDRHALAFDGLPVRLHILHTHVLRCGGVHRVTQRSLWSVIGAALNFVKHAATATLPARSGRDVAEHLQKIYRAYLAKFDSWFVSWVRTKQSQLRDCGRLQG